MKLLKSKLIAVAILCLLFSSCSKEDAIEDKKSLYNIDLSLVQKNDREISDDIADLINLHRAALGLNSLQIDYQYASAFAVSHTEYMIEIEAINHDNFLYRSDGIKYYNGAKTVAENVAYGYENAEKAVSAWLKSPEHKAIIEGNYTHAGLGVMKCSKNRNYFTMLFYKK